MSEPTTPSLPSQVTVGSASDVHVVERSGNGEKRRDWQLFSITALIVVVLGGVLALVCWTPPDDKVWPFADKAFGVLSYALTTALGGLLGQAMPRRG